MRAYTRFVDGAGLGCRLGLEEVGPAQIDLELPDPDRGVCSDTSVSCPILVARAVEAFRLLKVAASRTRWLDGETAVLAGSEYLPLIAFERNHYEAALDILAERLQQFREVAGFPFEPQRPKSPLAWVGGIAVEVHGGWVACGHVGAEPRLWRMADQPTEEPEEEDDAAFLP